MRTCTRLIERDKFGAYLSYLEVCAPHAQTQKTFNSCSFNYKLDYSEVHLKLVLADYQNNKVTQISYFTA